LIKQFYDIFPVDRKFTNESIWNVAGFILAGISGLGLQVLTAKNYGPAILGILNLTLIIFTIYSQISGFGIHFSVLKHVPEYAHTRNDVDSIMVSSLILTFFISLFFTIIFYLLLVISARLFSEKDLINSLFMILPVIVLFPLNKVMLSYLNGMRRMKLYAVYNSVRYVMWLVSIIVIIYLNIQPSRLPVVFPVSEGILFFTLLPLSVKYMNIFKFIELKKWNEINLRYGYKSVMGTIFADISTRIDVLILGIFTSNYLVGIYSMASVVMDGFSQLSITFRTLVNPIITKSYFNDDRGVFRNKIRKGKKLYYFLLIPLILAVITAYPYVIRFLNLNEEFNAAYIPLLIMMAGLLLSAGYQPFQMIFNQTGFPGYQTSFFGMILLSNGLLNICLIPFFGIIGASVSAAFSMILVPLYINYLSTKSLGFSF
jgi:O-antigen/teichoic acid export membrane protein